MKYLLDGEETERLLFRKIQFSDFDQWLEFHKNPETSKYWIAEKEDPPTECTKWYNRQLERYAQGLGGMNALIHKQTNALLGHSGLLVQTVDGVEELEVAYSLLPAFWNKGYATEAAMKCRDVAFQNAYADSLISIISLTNIPSQNVAMRLGMTAEKTTVYKDNEVYIFRIRKTQVK